MRRAPRALLLAPFVLGWLGLHLAAQSQLPLLGAGGLVAIASPPCGLSTGCVAAHSVTRRLVTAYSGNLFQLTRTGGGGGSQAIGQNGTSVDTAAVTTFCGVANANGCKFHIIYDQTGNGDDLTAVNCDVPITFDSNSLPMVTTGALINNGTSPCFLNKASPSNTPSGGVDASMYAVFTDGAIPNNQSCGFYGLYHSTMAGDTAGTDLGLIFRQKVVGHRAFGFDLEEEVMEAWVGTYSSDPTGGFTSLANPTDERLGRVLGFGSYTASTKTLLVDFNNENTYTYTGTWLDSSMPPVTTSSNTGGEIRLGAGGDGCATEAIWQEGAVWGRVLSAGERQNIATNTKAYYSIATTPTCGNTAVLALGQSAIQGAWGLRRINAGWHGALAIVHRDSDAAIRAILSSGCDIDLSALSSFCSGTTCQTERLVNQTPTGHLEDYRSGTADQWHLDQTASSTAPVVTFNCVGGTKPCLTFNGSVGMSASGGTVLSLTRPYSLWSVANRASGSYGGMLVFSGFQPYLGGGVSGNQALFQSSSSGGLTITSADGTWHALMGTVPDSTHVTLALNGTRTTSGTVTTGDASGATIFLGTSLTFTGTWTEGGVILSAISSGNEATIATNQCSYWGFTTC